MNKTFKRILLELLNHKTKLSIVVIAVLITSLSMLSFGHIFKNLIDQGIIQGDLSSIKDSIKQLAIIVAILGAGVFLRSYYINMISHLVITGVRLKSYRALLTLSPNKFDQIKIADYTNRFSHDINFIGDLITNLLSFSLRNFIMFIGGIILMFFVNIKLSLITLAILPISMVLVKILGKRIKHLTQKSMSEKANIEEAISETINNIKVIYSMDIKDYRSNILTAASNSFDEFMENFLKTRSIFFSFAISFITSIILIVIWVGGMDVATGNISSGNMVSFLFYALLTAFSIGGVADVFGDIQKFLSGSERIYEIIDSADLVREEENLDFAPAKEISLSIKDFAYPSRAEQKIIDKIDFCAKAGQFIGITGPSGSGKSTIFQILMGIYGSKNSKLMINHQEFDLSTNPLARSKIAYITQDPFIFSSTIGENIRLGRDFGNIDQVIDICDLKSLIVDMPKGLNTYVGERGMQLSGGQKQRIAIARALYGRPEIILLDEATSALDNKSEKLILTNIKKHMKDKIIFCISHNLGILKNADNIILIHNGLKISEGTDKELLKKSELYNALINIMDN